MAERLVTMRKYNEATGDYDVLYPNTLRENVKGLDELGGARITVTIEDGSAGQVVNLSGTKTATATTNADGVAIFDNLQYGEYLVTTRILGSTKTQNVTIDTLKIYEVFFINVSSTLEYNSWEIISRISAKGEAANYWNVGDTKKITINGTVGDTTFSNLSINAYILGINHNASVEGNNRIHFCIGKISGKTVGLTDGHYGGLYTNSEYFIIYPADGFVGGWNSCSMRSAIMPAIKNALPSDLQNVLKTVVKYTDNNGGSSTNSSNVTATTETICLEAEFEVQGARSYANTYEQNKQLQYDYYKNGNSKVRYKHNDTDTAVYWWNRSPGYAYYTYIEFCQVEPTGIGGYANVQWDRVIAPCFFV